MDWIKKNWPIILVLVIAIAIGVWWYSSQKKAEETAKKQSTGGGNTGSTGGGNTGGLTNPLGSSAQVKLFQQFANSKGETPALTVDGVWGPRTASAWSRWGAQFQPATSPNNTTNTSTPSASAAVGKTAKAAYSGIKTLNADGETYRNNYNTGEAVGTITNDKVLVYVVMNAAGFPYKRFNTVGLPWYESVFGSSVSADWYEVSTTAGVKYVQKSYVTY